MKLQAATVTGQEILRPIAGDQTNNFTSHMCRKIERSPDPGSDLT
jgi:hypothetical protein